MEDWQREGTIGFFLPEADEGWRSDSRRYDFPTLRVDRFRVQLSKSEDGLLSVQLDGLVDLPLVLQAPLPDGVAPVHVMIIWRNSRAQLYLGGESVALAAIPDLGAARKSANN